MSSEHPRNSSLHDEPAVSQQTWEAIAASGEFKKLVSAKARFVVPATLFFTVYYFALPVLVGWFPEVMKQKVGPVNLAYAFALSQFLMAWILAGIYVWKAGGWDRSAAEILRKFVRL